MSKIYTGWDDQSYFDRDEFVCHCNECGRAEMTEGFMNRLIYARAIADIPFNINSGYRCYIHNQNVGSTSSNHIHGNGADIACTDSRSRFIIIEALRSAGFKRIGVRRDFIHVDCEPGQPCKVLWLY